MFKFKEFDETDFTEYYQGMVELFGEDLAVEELKLELESYNTGAERYQKRLESSIQREEVTNDLAVKPVVQVLIPAVSDYIKKWIAKQDEKKGRRSAQYPVLKLLNPDQVAFIGIKLALTKLIKNELITVQNIGSAIGRALEEELRFNRLRASEEDFLSRIAGGANKRVGNNYKRAYLTSTEQHIIEQSNGTVKPWDRWSNANAISLGILVLEFIISSTGMFEREIVNIKGKSHSEIRITKQFKDTLVGRAFTLSSISPIYQPMVVPPKPWTNISDGGYYTKSRSPLSFLRINNKEALKRYDEVDLTPIFEAVNTAQDTAWKINSKVLEVVKVVYQWDNPIGGIPGGLEIELPPRINGMDEDTVEGKKLLKIWKKECIPSYRREKARISKRLSTEFIVGQADKFDQYKAIYFPHNLDFRGRIYAVPVALNPQGNDLCKGLLTFANGKAIGERGLFFLKVHGANCAGVDKLSFNDRIKWVHDNESMIIACATDPYNNQQWANMDSPFMFLAFCFEYLEVKLNGLSYRSSLPVSFDGSNSGAQHFSAMLRDEVGASAVNLLPSDKPQDIYQIVADAVVEKLHADVAKGTKNKTETIEDSDGGIYEKIKYGSSALASQWLKFGVSRKVTKRPVMTVVYSATKYGFSDQIMEDTVRPAIDAGKGYMFSEPRQACQYMADLIWTVCHEVIASAMNAMEWLKAAAKLLAKQVKEGDEVVKETLPVFWVTPDGFPVWQCYYKQKKVSILTLIHGKGARAKVSEDDTSSINANKQASGVAPNFVHSMDASHLRMTVNLAKSKYDVTAFSLVHDSFGTCAADADYLFTSIRESFVDMYEHNDVIQDFYYQFESQLHESQLSEMPVIPMKGSLDIRLILESLYCFA